jgi:hypothetical protein
MARSDELRRCATALGEKRSSQRHQQQPRHHRAGGRPARPPAARRRPGTSCSACPGAYKRIQSGNGVNMCNVGIVSRNGWGSLIVHNIQNIE